MFNPSLILFLNTLTKHQSFLDFCFREFVYTFSTTVIAFSTTFSVTASGFHIISYMDELDVLFQVIVFFYFS